MPRYLLVLPDEGTLPAAIAAALADNTGLGLAEQRDTFVLLANAAMRHLAAGSAGLVVGRLFHRHGPARPIAVLDDVDVGHFGDASGARLLRHFWGGYVALVGGLSRRLLRDPSGALPCYLARGPGCTLAASDVDLLLATGWVRPAIDWTALALQHYGAGLPRARTVLEGVWELLPGFALELPANPDRQRVCWTPWDHVAADDGAEPAQEAERIRRTVHHCVRGCTSHSGRVLLSLSGGLDSSIVAACLAGTGVEITCLTMFSDDPEGDERDYARALCARLGMPLLERPYRIEEVDIEAPLGAHLPRPIGRTQAQAYEQAHVEAASVVGADAFVSGNGGDNVFAYSQSASAITDRFMAEGLGSGVLRTLRDVCRQTGCSGLEAARAAMRIRRAPAAYRWRPSSAFLHPDLLAGLAGTGLDHPWLEAPPGALPGKAGHIAGLLRVQHNLEPGRTRVAPVINPLLSQPIMEACLAIPSWRWRSGGWDRSVARIAFAEDLPGAIARRRSKGGPDEFTARIVSHYRRRIRERLLDGHLAAHGLLDRDALDEALTDRGPTLGEERPRLLDLLATEAWLDFWCSRLSDLSADGSRPRAAARPNN